MLTLMGGSAVADGNGITIQLSESDLASIQVDIYLCTWRRNYISLHRGAVEDPAGIENLATTEDPNLIVRIFPADETVHKGFESQQTCIDVF